ncbi:MAG TPA: hypothetical protein VNU19_06795 [Candidatus Acidoferrum sp.]|jgi:hypothetical protein|nr:hypothetical protein [Candidatus Acidoferrum sp.]
MVLGTDIFLHFFGPRYSLPISLALYLYAAAGIVVISFALIVVVRGDQVGAKALQYPRRKLPFLVPFASSPLPHLVGGVVGILALFAVMIAGLVGSTDPTRNPAEYLTWIYFWTATVIASGLVGNLWYLLNPWAAMYDGFNRLNRLRPAWKLPNVGVWPAVATYLSFACLELTSGMANQPRLVALTALAYTALTMGGMILFGRDDWLAHCEAFTVLFDIVGRFGPVEAERDADGRITMVYLRAWGVGLLKAGPSGWDRVIFVILMLSTLAFDALIATPSWQDFVIELEPIWLPMGPFGFFFVRTLGLIVVTISFFLVFVAFMEAVIYFGNRKVDLTATVSAFALTLVPIALVYNAAHNYSSVLVQSQSLIPLLNDPLAKGWHLWPAVASIKPNFVLAPASTVWYAQVVLIVLGSVIAVYLSYLRAGERFRTAQRALLSQYPMLLLMVTYAMTSLWILAQPVTTGG